MNLTKAQRQQAIAAEARRNATRMMLEDAMSTASLSDIATAMAAREDRAEDLETFTHWVSRIGDARRGHAQSYQVAD